MRAANFHSAADSQDMQIQSSFDRGVADQWHALKSPVATYAKPFASPETPAVHRRMLGLSRYKTSRFDGNMQHGVMDRNPNQFAPDPGGDGNYRCQIMLYPQQAGIIETICWEGVREAFDDIRYATLLKRLAEPNLTAADPALRGEARRALAWLYQERSARYYEDPDPATLRKVVEVCDRMIAEEPTRDRESGYLRQAALMKAQTLESLGEHAAAWEAADLAVAASKGRVCDFECAKVYASIAYATGEWNESVARLAPFAEKLNAEENYRCAQALNAANRRAEAIPYLERAVQKCRNKYKRDGYDYLCQKLKAEAAKDGAN